MKPLLLRDGIPWFGQHTGYEQLSRYLANGQPTAVVTPRPGNWARYVGSASARLRGRMGRGATDLSELEFSLKRALQGPDISHVLYLEHHLELLKYLKKDNRSRILINKREKHLPTRTLATGLSIPIFDNIVAPSLVTNNFPASGPPLILH